MANLAAEEAEAALAAAATNTAKGGARSSLRRAKVKEVLEARLETDAPSDPSP